jgi:hypothetical protein
MEYLNMENLTARDRVVLLLSLFARERDINISITDAKRHGLDHLDKLELELAEVLNLQSRVL